MNERRRNGIENPDGTITHDRSAIRYALTKGAQKLREAGHNETAEILEDMVAGKTAWPAVSP